jgi:small subunit ribosomal protein S16
MRLTRVGSAKNPVYRIVVADQRAKRDGRNIETIGQYNPQLEPSLIEIDGEKAQAWLKKGAQPSRTVKRLLAIKGIDS